METCEQIFVAGELRDLCHHSCVPVNSSNAPIFKKRLFFKVENSKGDSVESESGGILQSGETFIEKHSGNDFAAYVFGGINRAMNINNNLFKVEWTIGGMRSSIVVTTGIPPAKRYAHGMIYLSYLKALAVFGGIGNQNGENVFLNDLHLFLTSNRHWMRLITDPDIEGRAFFGMSDYNKTGIIIFGGIGSKNFIDGSFHLFRLQQKSVDYLNKNPVDFVNLDHYLLKFGS